MKKRLRTSRSAVESTLFKSRRRCALCFATGDDTLKSGNVAHIVPLVRTSNSGADNLVFLCSYHHAALDRGGPGKPSTQQIRAARKALYRAIGEESSVPTSRP